MLHILFVCFSLKHSTEATLREKELPGLNCGLATFPVRENTKGLGVTHAANGAP